ncbi:MAG: elongation factor 4 [Elusimicrobia bacterium]|nr:elongation factor 4 [Elusimicrobiota bacterium]
MSETNQTQAPLINIRNFCIIAHIDHGKSTLADRLLEKTGTIPMRQMQAQVLDRMDLERERGITIKAKAVRMIYKNQFILDLIDTPGHVDFSYEVSRSLAACEGALLVVDASQGVEAQTLANTLLAQESGLELIPVINKIDLPQADIEGTARQIKDILKIEKKAIAISAKEGKGIEELLDMIVELIPPPKGEVKEPLSALVFDSLYDPYKGVIIFVRVFSGLIQPKKTLLFLSNGIELTPEEVGYLTPLPSKSNQIMTGEVGYVVTGLKDIHLIQIGDTLTEKFNPTSKSLPGYRPTKPFVFAGLYPPNPSEYETLKNALEKLHLSDSSFQFQPESSNALGFGYRCGFLGLLHLEIIKERLLREFSIDVLLTSPNVIYQIKTKQDKGQASDSVEIDSPSKFPSYDQIDSIAEPIVNTMLLLPAEYVGPVMQMAKERRGEFKDMRYLTPERVLLRYHMPLAEIIIDFHDALKSLTKGYASFDYEPVGYRKDDLVKLEILIHHEVVDAFSSIAHKDKAYSQGKALVEKLRELIPKHLFEIAIQAQVHNKIIARETIKAFRKDVIAKCYGGDITRKRKLLEKQKEGKRKMKQIGNVEIPNEAFLSILQLSKKP